MRKTSSDTRGGTTTVSPLQKKPKDMEGIVTSVKRISRAHREDPTVPRQEIQLSAYPTTTFILLGKTTPEIRIDDYLRVFPQGSARFSTKDTEERGFQPRTEVLIREFERLDEKKQVVFAYNRTTISGNGPSPQRYY